MDGHRRRLVVVKAVGKTVTRLDELTDMACEEPKEIPSGAVKDWVSNVLDIECYVVLDLEALAANE